MAEVNSPVVATAMDVPADDWRTAVRAAAQLLVDAGTAAPQYVQACVDTVEEFGPYIVLAPGLALAHARPELGSLAPGLSAALLANPVDFGHPDNDPVDLVLGFTADDKDSHVTMLAGLARQLQEGLAQRLREADSSEAMRTLMGAAA